MGTPNVAVIGAGVAGAMAAYRLRQAGLRPVVYESNDYIGGRARTIRQGGFTFDTGAVGLLGSYNRTRDVAREIGMADRFLTLKPIGAIPKNGVLHQLDMAHPVRSFATTGLYSLRSKLKLLKVVADVYRLRHVIDYEQVEGLIAHDLETVQDYSLRELNDELYEYLTGALTRGAWLAPAELSSVIQFFWTAKHFTPHMYSLLGGMSSLPETLLAGSEVHLNTRVLEVHESGTGVQVTLQNAQGEQQTQTFDACVIAVPPQNALPMFPQLAAAQRAYFEGIEYSRSVNVHLGLSDLPNHPEMYVMVPKRESPDLTTVFLDHRKAPDRAPAGKAMLSVFLNAQWCADRYSTSDQQVLDEVLGKLQPYFGVLDSKIEQALVQRWDNCALLVKPGIFARMHAFKQAIDPAAKVQLAGDYAPFSSINTAIISGEAAAVRLVARLR
ncbi:MAG TPA: NAD(P)/FAD-dependent oxidoreductase [Macromonas sp.]|nr:NAD(P)/FAD-dependent oxidoreductase [Macromonas sp.]